jgi:hypothetical protein
MNKSKFVAWLNANCPHFSLLQLLANGSKHCFPVHSTEIVKCYGRGPYGVGPYGRAYLLIDPNNHHTIVECYLVGNTVLRAIAELWDGFFTTHGITDDALQP